MRLLPAAVLLTLLACLAVVGVRLVSHAAGQPVIEQTAVLLRPPPDCSAPCWQGIRPGSTTSSDGIDHLNHMPWMTNLSVIQGIVSYDSIVRWGWQQPPPGIDARRDGRMWTHQGQVYLIELPLTLQLATVWNALGPPDWIELTRSPQQPPAVFLHAAYAEGRLTLDGIVECPVSWWRIWTAPVDARYQDLPRSPSPDPDDRPQC
jgi:hypothetical protein